MTRDDPRVRRGATRVSRATILRHALPRYRRYRVPGRAVLARLLAREDCEAVYALVRRGSVDKLRRRTRELEGADKLVTVTGDLTAERLGLSDETIIDLAGQVDEVLHLGAIYDVTADDAANRAANVDGTRHVVAVTAEIGAALPAPRLAASPWPASTPGCSPRTTSTSARSSATRTTRPSSPRRRSSARSRAPRGASTGPPSSSATRRPARWTRSTGPYYLMGAISALARPARLPAGAGPRAGRDQHRPGRLRRRRDGRPGAHPRPRRPGVPPGQPPPAAALRDLQRAGRRRSAPPSSLPVLPARPSGTRAHPRRRGTRPHRGRRVGARHRAGRVRHPARGPPAPDVPVRLLRRGDPSRGALRTGLASPRRSSATTRRCSCDYWREHLDPNRARRTPPGPPLLRTPRGHHRRLVGHRAGDRDQGRPQRRRPAPGRAAHRRARGAQAPRSSARAGRRTSTRATSPTASRSTRWSRPCSPTTPAPTPASTCSSTTPAARSGAR